MKLSVVIAGADAPESAFVVWRGYEASMRKARALGYQGVELALGDAADVEEAQLLDWKRETGLAVSCISTGLVYARRGLYLTHPQPEKRAETVRAFQGLVDLASRHGGLVNIGRARGWVGEGQTRAEAEALFYQGLECLLPQAEAQGVTLLIEPVNRYEINFINNLDEARELLARTGSRHVGIMADLFHMNIEDDRIEGALERNYDYVRYLHVADSNRRAPGQGHTGFRAVLRTLKRLGYQGWLSAEVLPGADADATAQAAAEYMLRLMREEGVE